MKKECMNSKKVQTIFLMMIISKCTANLLSLRLMVTLLEMTQPNINSLKNILNGPVIKTTAHIKIWLIHVCPTIQARM